MKNNDIRDIIIGTIIVVVLFAVGAVSPLFGSLCTFCIPLPLIFYRVKTGRIPALIIAFASFIVILTLVRGFKFDLMFVVQLLAMGVLLGESFALKFSVNKAFLITLIAVAVIMALWVCGFSINAGTSPGVMLGTMIDGNIAITLDFYRTQGFSAQDIATMEDMFMMVKPWVIKFMPAGALATYMFTIWANILLARTLLKRANLPWPYQSFAGWSVPGNVVFVALAAALVWFLTPQGSNAWVISVSVLLILLPVYCFQGLAIFTQGMERAGFAKPLQVVAYIVVMIFWPLIVIISMLPFVDMWVNFRKTGKTV